jgi:hypothetical protein
MKNQILLIFISLIFLLSNFTESKKNKIKVECFRIERDTIHVFTNEFDSHYLLKMHKTGNFLYSDSMIYEYDFNNNLVNEIEYMVYSGFTMKNADTTTYKIDDFFLTKCSQFYTDTFMVYDDLNFKEIVFDSDFSYKVDTLISDSGINIKCTYYVNGAIFMCLPFLDNDRGTEKAVVLDSLEIQFYKNQILNETYHFIDRKITRFYYYKENRLIKKETNVCFSDGKKDGFYEIYKYSLIKE